MSTNSNNAKKPQFNFYWIYIVIIVVAIAMQYMYTAPQKAPIKLQSFYTLADSGFVKNVELVNRSRVDFKLTEAGENFVSANKEKYSDIYTAIENEKKINPNGKPKYQVEIPDATSFATKIQDISDRNQAAGKAPIEVKRKEEVDYFRSILNFILPILVLVLIWVFVMRKMSGGFGGGGAGGGGNIFNIGKSKAQVYEKGRTTNVTFADVAGLKGAKEEIEEIVDFLKNPQRYTELGAKIPKGALLVGPPGTGKTLLAKAVAGEAKVPFFSLSGSDFVEMFVGVGASRVRDLFRQAKEKAPAIIFIDEIDAIGRARGKNNSFNSNDERENTLNQLLTEMDGFGTNTGVIILAATNRAEVLDSALMRAGRFDRQIYVDMPDVNERKAIFNVHLKPLKLEENLDIDFLAKQTPGFSGADIANICNEAALIAARKQKKSVSKQDFLVAVDRIVGGLEKKDKIITPHEKRAIAFHEAGHATTSWLLEHAHPLVKVTIVPRGRSLGAAWYLPEERSITTTEQIL
ncbi:MAG TPA: ATP-dependent zinc metalloprotease FtsH, partial [Crocinitomicaceae bacterium]|nr:ATP-dependent zinc metalloprotease FtsH [Crocinitomicaceae bacterium]